MSTERGAWIDMEEVIWKAGQFSRPPLTSEQLHNLRVRLEVVEQKNEAQRGDEGEQ